jgi:hypothetical protein
MPAAAAEKKLVERATGALLTLGFAPEPPGRPRATWPLTGKDLACGMMASDEGPCAVLQTALVVGTPVAVGKEAPVVEARAVAHKVRKGTFGTAEELSEWLVLNDVDVSSHGSHSACTLRCIPALFSQTHLHCVCCRCRAGAPAVPRPAKTCSRR